VRESSAAWVESREVIPRPITRRPLDEPEELDALRELLLLPCDLPPELRAPLLELPFPPLALVPPLFRFGMLILG
jgi:hypothetical protein